VARRDAIQIGDPFDVAPLDLRDATCDMLLTLLAAVCIPPEQLAREAEKRKTRLERVAEVRGCFLFAANIVVTILRGAHIGSDNIGC
jgi:hypothetical protein